LAVNVADLKLHEPDASGVEVERFYARNPPKYAVYQTAQRVTVQFADDPAKSDEQRKALAQLAPVRGEINGMVDGWRSASLSKRVLWIGPKNGTKLRARAARYDRNVADALVVALEGDLTGAGALLSSIKDDAMGERVGWARFEYLVMAFATTVVLTLFGLVVGGADSSDSCGGILCVPDAGHLWRGSVAGSFGAFFSIALSIRGRTILTDLYRTSNLMDAVLRVIIGALAGTVLVALIVAGLVKVHIGGSAAEIYGAMEILIFGFVAGFAERLVPDLLAKVEARTGEPPTIRRPEPDMDADRKRRPEKAGGAAAGADAEEGADDADAADPVPEQSSEDSCAADIELPDDEATPDSELPPASGGVERVVGGADQ